MEELDKKLQTLYNTKDWNSAVGVVSSICGLFGLEMIEDPFLFQHPKINAHTSWFMNATGFVNRPASYEIKHDNKNNLDIKLYWGTKISKTILSWMVGISPNFEDAKTFESEKYNIGLDIVIPKECDGVILLVSNKYKIRSFELKEKLSRTDKEIIEKLQSLRLKSTQSVEDKRLFHNILWDAFNFEPINRKFYKELVDRFTVLRDHLVKKGFDKQDAVIFSTRLIGRILFVWFLRKKKLINEKAGYFDSNDVYNQTTYYKDKLEKLFFETLNTEIIERGFDDVFTPYLNGGLFEASRTDFYKDIDLTIPDGYFSQFFEILSHYNFTVDESSPEFEQVAVDPEMLGRIFESLLAEQSTETGEQARKAKGAFYTPREIVQYMCEESLKEYLKTKIEDDTYRDIRIEEVVSMSEAVFRDQDHNKRRDWKPYVQSMTKALDELTVLDPAVGSGAYPMGMLHLLVKVYTRLDSKYEKNLSKLKRSILNRSLFGSDIDLTAIEICRLRAWLSLIVDLEENEQVAPLPNLEFHFVCANSLLSLNKDNSLWDTTDLKENMKQIRTDYYNTSSKTLKETLKKKYNKLSNPSQNSLLSESENDNILKTYQPFSHESRAVFFDPDLMFGVEKFNVVVGNPPYVGEKGHKEIFQPIAKSSLGKRFYLGKMDLFYFFFHLGLDLLQEGGVLSFISTNYYITATGAKKLRDDFKNRSTVLDLVNFNELKIFESALGQHNLITILQKGNYTRDAFTASTKRKGYANGNILENITSGTDTETEYAKIQQDKLFSGGNIVMKSSALELILDKIKLGSKNLDKICTINQGIVTGADKVSASHLRKYKWKASKGDGVFVLNSKEIEKINNSEIELLKPWYKNSDATLWATNNTTSENILYLNGSTDEGKIPSIINHLEKFKDNLQERREVHKGARNWYDLWWSRNQIIFEGEKIVAPQRSKTNTFGYNNIPWYAASDVFFITQPKDDYKLKFILGVLNSNTIYHWLYNRGKRKGEMLETIAEPLSAIPIPLITTKNKVEVKQVEVLVNKILDAKKDNKDSDTKELENQINELVMDLYELNDEEKKIIRNSIK